MKKDEPIHNTAYNPTPMIILMRPIIILLVATFLFATNQRALAQEESTDTSAPAEPPTPDASAPPTPTPPAVWHPPVERPPLPEPPAHITLPTVDSKPNPGAAWRLTAQLLAAGKKIERPSAAIILDAGYGEGLLSVLASCPRAGLKVTALNSDAGEVLAIKPDSSISIVITITEISPGKTRIAAGCHRCNGEAARNTIATILQICTDSLRKQERI
ncbi:MAG: hypothetical protein K2W95_31815 [Candidatus Obscuribacterales bacterium]|nr:hypothetical protein [Candidatus Obscuribacterales bacterium]